jgi:signal transduction histidine kinase
VPLDASATPPDFAPAAPRTPLRVLHLEDSEDDSTLIMRALERGGFDPDCKRVETRVAFKAALEARDWDVIISDYSLPGYDGMSALADMREWGRDVPFILVSGTIGEAVAVEAMRAGAQDYVLKDGIARLPLAVGREVREGAIRADQRKMREQLATSERMATAGVLAAGVAHEINNPLAVVLANLELIANLLGALPRDARPREVDAPLSDAREAGERIRRIVRDVKLFSRSHYEERDAVDLTAVIESSIRMAWNEIRHRAQLTRAYGDVPRVDSNEARLGQVVLNLLVNAAQSIPEGRASQNEIRVVTRMAESGRVVLEVRDTGSGIPREILPRIFDPFFTTKPVGVGTGLGLSLCHRMVSDLGGEIGVESEVGKGTVFRVTLPVATSKPRAVAPARVAEEPVRRARVLVVDDEVSLGRVLERSLRGHHDVLTLTKGREALNRIAAGERFDVIVSDLMMPDVTGMDLYEQLLLETPDQATRMIFLTGGAFTDRAREFLDRVPNPRSEKPFDVSTILAMIAVVLRR